MRSPTACAMMRTAGATSRHLDAPRPLPQPVADTILQSQRAEVRVGDGWMRAREFAGDRARRVDVRHPVEGRDAAMERGLVGRIELGDFKQHATGNARPEAGAVANVESTAKLNPTAALANIERSDLRQLACQ